MRIRTGYRIQAKMGSEEFSLIYMTKRAISFKRQQPTQMVIMVSMWKKAKLIHWNSSNQQIWILRNRISATTTTTMMLILQQGKRFPLQLIKTHYFGIPAYIQTIRSLRQLPTSKTIPNHKSALSAQDVSCMLI